MEAAETRGRSRRQQPKSLKRKDNRVSHFQTVRRGGFEESQVICRLWDIVKVLEADGRDDEMETGGISGMAAGTKKLADLEKQLRRQIRVEMRRYFVRRRRRNVNLILRIVLAVACVVCLFGTVIGIDRVSGESMYPYLNHGDWILFSRISREYHRDEVVVFEKNGENLVKRIAGLPGDVVRISNLGNHVEINGSQMEDYAVEQKTDQTDLMGSPQTVMDGQYLVLGDNRRVSIDSRDKQMGTVSEEEILGRVILVLRVN